MEILKNADMKNCTAHVKNVDIEKVHIYYTKKK